MAKLYLRYGAMNSGKTAEMLIVAHNYKERGMEVAVIKPEVDTKGQDKVVSRIGIERKVDILLGRDDSAKKSLNIFRKSLGGAALACILVDEAQFITPDQADEFFWYAVEEDIPVMAYGLRTDFQTKGFPGTTRLLELAHDIEEYKTICRCGIKAVFNGRKVDGQFVREGAQVAIDDNAHVEYESLCAMDYGKLVLGLEIPDFSTADLDGAHAL